MLGVIRITVQSTIRHFHAAYDFFRSDLNLDATGGVALGLFHDIGRHDILAVIVFPSLAHGYQFTFCEKEVKFGALGGTCTLRSPGKNRGLCYYSFERMVDSTGIAPAHPHGG